MKLRVFLVDDEKGVRDVLENLIKRRGHEVISYDYPWRCEFMQSDKCECPPGYQCTDIIISDKLFDRGDGVGFLKKQIQRGCKVRFMALISAVVTPEEYEWAEKNGIKVFGKPFRYEELYAWIDKCEDLSDPDRILIDANDAFPFDNDT